MASKLTDAELVLCALTNVIEGKELHRLIDVGINLADPSYDKVRGPVLALCPTITHEVISTQS